MPENSASKPRPLLRLENVGKTFRMGEVLVEVLRNINLDIRPGEFLALIGPSGSGKTTLINLVGGLDTPTAGKTWFGDQDLTHFNARELTRYRRETIGFVFQFYNLVPNLTARENVMVATELSDNPLDVDETLRLVGLADRMEHFPSQMSGGEQQRVAIAREFAKNPDILLCDEPTGALDFATGKLVLQLLLDVKRQFGKTVVVITHNVVIGEVADRVVRLRSGEIVDVTVNARPATPEEISW